jgi:hypothetical protein
MMAEELAKIDTEVKIKEPKAPASGRMSFSDIMGVRQPFIEKQGQIQKEISRTEGEILAGQQAQKEMAAEGKMEVEKRTAEQVRGAQQNLQERMQAEPLPAFVPSQDNFRDIAGLFSLIGVMGMIAGKSNSIAAMNAMNGMLEGYRSGRNDLYRREREVFDKNFKTMLQKHAEFRKEMEDAVKLAQTDRQAGLQAADLAAVKAGSEIVRAQIRRGDLLGAYNTVGKEEAAAFKAVQMVDASLNAETAARERAAQAARAEAQRNVQLLMTPSGPRTADITQIPRATAEELAGATPFRGSGQQTRAGQNALQFASRVYGNIENAATDLASIVILPAVAESPIFAGIIGSDPARALASLSAFGVRTITKPELKAFEQITNSLDAALARLEAQGLASGATKSTIQSFNALKPRAGDKAINMALYIARVKQEIETGIRVHDKMPGATPEQRAATKEILNNLDKVVPYDVQDVLTTLGRGRQNIDDKMQRLLSTPPVARGYGPEVTGQAGAPADAAAPAAPTAPPAFNSVEEAEAANLPVGTKITINGRPATVR